MSTALEPLVAGQRMNRAEFHERYKEAPAHLKFELIEGVVVMASPLGKPHARNHMRVMVWLGTYEFQTPGVEAFDNASAALGDLDEVQPDVSLRIRPALGGQSHDLGEIIGGAPELVVEVADSSRRIDLGPKLAAYDQAGVLEYIVLALDPFDVIWHARRDGQLVRVPPDGDGLYRSTAFPGLWLDPAALGSGDGPALLATLGQGLASPEHAAFVARLAAHPGGDDA